MIARIVNKVPATIAQWAGREPGRYVARSAGGTRKMVSGRPDGFGL